jgi:hypothetical protein
MTDSLYADSRQNRGDTSIQANNFGGINTEASPLNSPYGDSPDLLNVDVSPGGLINKRKGTRQLFSIAKESGRGVGLFSVQLPSGHTVLVSKRGLSLEVGYVTDGLYKFIYSAVNTFHSGMIDIVPSFVYLGGNRNTVLILLPRNVPVLVHLINAPATAGSTTFTYLNPDFKVANSPPIIVFKKNNVWSNLNFTGWSFASEPYTTTPTNSADLTGVQDAFAILPVWQWVAEGYAYFGNRFYDTVNRFAVNPADRIVAIPENIRDGVEGYISDTVHYGIYAAALSSYSNGTQVSLDTLSTSYQHTTDVNNTSSVKYLFSDGGLYTIGGYAVQRTPNFIRFGDEDLTGTGLLSDMGSAAVNLCRSRRLYFNGGGSWDINNVKARLTFTTSYGVITTTSTPFRITQVMAGYLDFIPVVATTVLGVPKDDIVRIVHTNCPWKGTFASSDISNVDLQTSVPVPFYGIGEFADYAAGYFPSCGAKFGDRLALGGVASDAKRIVVSAISDTRVPGEPWQDFQIDVFNTADGAYDVLVDGDASDYVSGIASYQGSLVVCTNESTFRVVQTQSGVGTQKLGDVGISSFQCLSSTDDRVILSGKSGVYQVTQAQGLSDSLALAELSTKIKSVLLNRTPKLTAYDSVTKKLYVVLDDGYAYIFYTDTGSWTKHLFHNSLVKFALPFSDVQSKDGFMLVTEFSAANTCYLKTEEAYLDYTTKSAASTVYSVSQNITIVSGVKYYKHLLNGLPLTTVQDLTLSQSGSALLFQVQWFKVDANSIYIPNPPSAGTVLTLTQRNPSTPGNVSYGYLAAKGDYGYVYLSYFSTPYVFGSQLAAYKRLIHFNLLLNTALGGGRWAANEIASGGSTTNAGLHVNRLDGNLTFLYSDELDGTTAEDVYPLLDLVQTSNDYGDTPHVLVREPVQGIGYSFRALLWSWDDSVFSLSGYQLDIKTKGKRYQR